MSYLCLDLDETLITMLLSFDKIHPETVCSNEILSYVHEGYPAPLQYRIINPEEISALISKAYEEHDGVIILTAGGWDRSILKEIVEHLDLSPEVSEKFLNCRFHSSITDAKLFNTDPVTVSQIDKHTRLKRIVESDKELQDKQFVLVDNDEEHCNSFENSDIGVAVWADTTTLDTTFYNQAGICLDMQQECEEAARRVRQQILQVRKRQAELQQAKKPCADSPTRAAFADVTNNMHSFYQPAPVIETTAKRVKRSDVDKENAVVMGFGN